MNDERYGPPPPPKLPPKSMKKKFLKAPLTAIKNAFIKSTKQLRRQNSMVDHERQSKMTSSLRRQHSMMEQRSSGRWRSSEFQYHPQYYDERPRAYDDQYYDDRGYSRNQPQIYDDYDKRNYYEQENLYANRALIELERKANENVDRMPYQTNTGTRIMRRHSMADRASRPLMTPRHNMMHDDDSPERIVREEIYQTRSGAYMMQQTNIPMKPRRAMSVDNRDDEPIYQSRREMHLDHLYQSKKEMQQRIHQGRLEVERSAQSESPSSSSAATTPVHSDRTSSPAHELLYQSRRELKEKGFKTRTQLRDHIYQTRREAMESMAEPNYGSSKRVEIQRHQEPIIYETKENNDPTPDNGEAKIMQNVVNESNILKELPQVERIRNTSPMIGNQNSCNSSGLDEEDTINSPNQSGLQKTVVAAPNPEEIPTEDVSKVIESEQVMEKTIPARALSPRADRAHLSNIMKRVAPPPPIASIQQETQQLNNPGPSSNRPSEHFHASRTSMETQYTSSQISLPIGPPAAQSTPYASDVALENPYPPLREQTTTRGVVDENGGTLCDNVWNVSINIPKGAIPPGIQQEIYFTVTDPRMSQTVGGPPLDMENGWC